MTRRSFLRLASGTLVGSATATVSYANLVEPQHLVLGTPDNPLAAPPVHNKFYANNYGASEDPLTYGLRAGIEDHNADMLSTYIFRPT